MTSGPIISTMVDRIVTRFEPSRNPLKQRPSVQSRKHGQFKTPWRQNSGGAAF